MDLKWSVVARYTYLLNDYLSKYESEQICHKKSKNIPENKFQSLEIYPLFIVFV